MEIKSKYSINKELVVEDDGFDLIFTPEEKIRLEELADKKNITVEDYIGETVYEAMKETAKEIRNIVENKNHNSR